MGDQPLHTSLLDTVGQLLVTGELPEGRVFTLDQIVQDHAVSRSVAREAIRVLESMGLVASKRRIGLTVRPRSAWNVFDPRLIRWRLAGEDRTDQLLTLSELRAGFEPEAASLAARRADAEQCRILASAVSDMTVHGRSGDLDAYLRADTLFHRTLLEASGNEMMRALGDLVAEVLAGRTHHHLMPSTPEVAAIGLHDDVARAVRTGDPAAAEAAMRSIIAEAAEALRDQLHP